MAFDVAGARADGYSEEEIAAYLEKNEPLSAPKFDITADKFDVQGALNDGYTENEIADFVTKKYGTVQQPVQTAQAAPKSESQRYLENLQAGTDTTSSVSQRKAQEEKNILAAKDEQKRSFDKVLPAIGQALKASPLKFGEGLLQFMNTINEYTVEMPGKLFDKATGGALAAPNISKPLAEEWSLQLRDIAKKMEPAYERGTPEYYSYNATLSLVQNIGPIALGTITGSEWLALMMMGGTVAGEKKNELMEKGYSEDQASVIGGMYGAAEVIGEKISIGKVIKGPMLSRIILGTAYDIPGELLTEVLQAGIDKGILKEDDAFNWDRFIDTAIITGLSGPILGFGSGAISKVQQRAARKDFSGKINGDLASGELTIIDPNAPKAATGQWFGMPQGIGQQTQEVEAPVVQSPITLEKKDTGAVALTDNQEVGSYDGDVLTISPDYQGDRVALARQLLEGAINTLDNERGSVTLPEVTSKEGPGKPTETNPAAKPEGGNPLFPENNRLSNINKDSGAWSSIQAENPNVKDWNKDIIIYRATVGDEIRINDFVAINPQVAKEHLQNLKDRGEKGKLIKKKVTAADLLMANDATEFVYSPQEKQPSNLSSSPGEGEQALVTSIRNTLNEKGSIDLTPIVDLGRSVYQQGATTFEKFSQRIQDLVGNAWDKVKDFVRQAWDVISNESGKITVKDKPETLESYARKKRFNFNIPGHSNKEAIENGLFAFVKNDAIGIDKAAEELQGRGLLGATPDEYATAGDYLYSELQKIIANRAKNKTMSLLSEKERDIIELREDLKRDGYNEREIEEIINEAERDSEEAARVEGVDAENRIAQELLDEEDLFVTEEDASEQASSQAGPESIATMEGAEKDAISAGYNQAEAQAVEQLKQSQSFEEFENVIFGNANVGDTFAEDPLAKHMTKAELKAFREKGLADARIDDLKDSISALKSEIGKARTLANDFFRAGRKIGALDQLERVHQMEAMRKQRQAVIKEGTKLKNFLKNTEKKIAKSTTIDPEYRKAVQDAIDLNADGIEAFILTQLQNGDVFMLDEGQLDMLRQADPERPTIDDLRNRVSIVRQLVYQGRKARQIEVANERFERKALIGDINKEVRGVWGVPEIAFGDQLSTEYFVTAQKDMKTKRNVLTRMMQSMASVLKKAEYIIENLAGYKENSLLKRATFDKIVEAERTEINLSKETAGRVRDAFALIKDDYASGKLDSLMNVQGLTMERKKAIAIALNSGNEGNRRALREGTEGMLTDDRIDAIVNFLDPNERVFVKAVWDILEWQRPYLQDAYRKMTGENMKLVEGQYYPLMFDKRYATRIAQAQEEQNLFRLYGNIASVQRGMTKSRTGGTMTVDLDFMKILQHIDDVNHFVAYGQAVRDVNRIISNQTVKSAVSDAIGEPYNKALKNWLKSIANPQYDAMPGWDKLMGRLRNNSATAILGFGLSTTLLQPLAITQTVNRLGVVDTLKGFTDFYRDYGALSQFIEESSPFMTLRASSFDATLKEIMEGDKDKVWNQGKATDKIRQSFFSLIGLTDKMVTMPTWYAAYQKEMAKSQDHQKAVDFADQIVRQSQSSGMPKDLSEVQRGNNTRKAFVMFYSYFSTTYNEMARSVDLVKHKEIGYLGLMRSFFWVMMVPTILQAIVKNRGFYDDDEPEKKIPVEIAKELVGYGAGTIPVIGSAINSFMDNYEYRPAPAMDVVKQASILAQTTKKLVSGDTSYNGKGVHPALRSGAMLAGYAFGLPSRQAMRIADEAWNAYDEGEVSWQNAYGLVYKERKK